MKTKSFLLILLIILPAGKIFTSDSTILDKYVRIGLKNNLALKQRDIDLKRSLAALKEAKGMFLPTLTLMARYTRAGGGRLIEIPTGDMLNPAYSALNSLLKLHNLPGNFPTNIQNELIPFLREKEQETKLRLVQPVFEPSLFYNYKIKKKLSEISGLQTRYYRRKLAAEIKKAYFNSMKASQGLRIFQDMKILLEEALRISKSLYKNGKVTEDVIFRGKAELSNMEQQIIEAGNIKQLSASYFNFLLNRPLSERIEEMKNLTIKLNTPDLPAALRIALSNREELNLLKHRIKTAGYLVKLNKSSYLPGVIAVVDYGFQGINYSFTGQDDYWSASLLLNWKIFNGFRDKHKVRQNILERKKLELEFQEVINQIRLQTKKAYDDLNAHKVSLKYAEDRLKSIKKSYDIVFKKYKNGMAAQIEYFDAQTSLAGARINLSIKKFDYMIAQVESEFIAALETFKEQQKAKSNHKER